MLQTPHRSQPEVRRAASKTGAVPVGAKKLAQHGPSSCVSAKKLAQHATKCQFWGVLSVQGELFRAHAHIRPSRAKFFAHTTRQRGDIETNDTTARLQQGTAETGITSAPENWAKNAHFSPAKAMAVSPPHTHQRAKAITVSNHRSTGPTAPGCGARGRRRHHHQPNVARNLSWSFFETPQKRCNSNAMNSMFELVEGELRAELLVGSHSWVSGRRAEPARRTTNQHTRPHWCGGDRRAWLRCPWAAAGPGRTTSRRTEPKARGADGSRAGRRPRRSTAQRAPDNAYDSETPAASATTSPRGSRRDRPR